MRTATGDKDFGGRGLDVQYRGEGRESMGLHSFDCVVFFCKKAFVKPTKETPTP